jgi:hypothetical protein
MDSEAQGYVPHEHNKVNGLEQQDSTEKCFDVPTAEATTIPRVPKTQHSGGQHGWSRICLLTHPV